MPRQTVSRLGAALRGLLSLAILLALLGAVPFLLWRTGALPHQLPDWNDVTTALTSPDNGSLFLGALTLIGWGAWLSFICSTVIEVVALLRRRRAPRVRALGATQRLSAVLVAGVALLLPTTAFAASPAASAAPIAATAPATTATSTQDAPSATPEAFKGPVHAVVSGDTLWDLAQHYLGNGTRWHEIADLNPQINSADLLPVGATLRLPADASPPAAPATTAPPTQTSPAGQHTVTVHQGDTLSQIAERELGDGNRYPELLEATRDVVQPDGAHLTDADRLFPGNVVVVPAAAAPAQPAAPTTTAPPVQAPAPAAQAPAAPQTPPSTTPVPQQSTPASPTPSPSAPAASAPAAPAPAASAPATADTEPPTAPAPEHSAPAGEAPAAPHGGDAKETASSEAPVSAQEIGGIAALLGAGVLAVIARRRRAQQNARRPGETIAMPEDTTQAEQVLDRTSSPGSVDLLDRALRTLAHEHPDVLPTVRGARVTADRVEILVDDSDAEPLAPFTARSGGWWSVRADRATLLNTEEARQVPAPYPGLSTIGTADDGTLLLGNLPEFGVLLLDGDETSVREVARGITMEAGTSLWADHIEVLSCGFGLELQQLLPAGRVMYSPSLETARADLARVLIEAHQAEHEGGEPPQPWLVVCATSPTPDELYEFADLLGKARGLKVAAVLPAAGARDLFPDATVLDASLPQAQHIDVLGSAALQRVTDEAYRQLTATMTTASKPAKAAVGAWTAVPDPDRPHRGPAAIDLAGTRSHLLLLPEPDQTDDQEANVTTTAQPETKTAQATAADSDLAGQVPAPDAASTVTDSTPTSTATGPGPGSPAADPRAAMLTGPTLTKNQPVVTVVREHDPAPEPAATAPQVQVLGPLRITGLGDTAVPPKLCLLAALLIFKNERDYGSIASHMNPARPWAPRSMDQEMSRLRAHLGVDSQGVPYLRPKPRGVQQYSLSEEVTVDWSDFLHLAERGLPHGPNGVRDLEAALALVRGRPFGGAGTHSWAAPIAQTMISRIVDTAHAVAMLRCRDEVLDIDAARAAITIGLDTEPTAEVLYRDWMRVEHRAGNVAALRSVIDQVRQMASDWEFDHIQDDTELLITRLTTGRGTVQGL